jgi:hypothetical protein
MVCASWPFGEWKVMGFFRDHRDAPLTSYLHIASIFMIDLLAYLSWLLANVAIPIFAPVALLPLLSFSLAYRGVAAVALKAAVRHGQLFWTVIAMCSAACYELGGALAGANSASSRALIWIALVWHTGSSLCRRFLWSSAPPMRSCMAAPAPLRRTEDKEE